MKSNITIALFADHLESYSDTLKLLLITILLCEQFHWFLVLPWFWGEKCLVCVWTWFCFTSLMQKELICHLKKTDIKSVCFFLLFHLLKNHKGVFRILKTENSFLNSFSRRKTVARVSLCSCCPPPLCFSKHQSNCY